MTADAAPLPDPAASEAEPYPGLRPFTEKDQDLFFGREQEKGDLFRLVGREALTVLFGVSGLGKTSLLRAGLFPRLRSDDHFPIYIRLDHHEESPPWVEQIKSIVRQAVKQYDVEAEDFAPDETLWEYFHRVRFWSSRNRLLTPVLVIDQFEEIFTLGKASRARVDPFTTEIGDLVENQIPVRVRERIEETGEALGYRYSRRDAKVLLSLREDFLPQLEELRGKIPSIVRNRYRLRGLRGRMAIDAIAGPAPELISTEVAEEIVRYVSRARGDAGEEDSETVDLESLEVEPSLLSLFCRELNDRRLRTGQTTITKELVDDAKGKILSEFYRRCVHDQPPKVRRYVEEQLLTENGFRTTEALEDALILPGVTREAIEELIDRRVLRVEYRLGIPHIELIHDVLLDVAVESRDEARAARKKQQRLRTRAVAMGALGAAVLAVSAALFVYTLNRERDATRTALSSANRLIMSINSGVNRELRAIGQAHLLRGVTAATEDYFDSLGEDLGSDPTFRRTHAIALREIGRSHADFGASDEALEVLEESLAMSEELYASSRGLNQHLVDLAETKTQLGSVLSDHGETDAALAQFGDVIAHAEAYEELIPFTQQETALLRELQAHHGESQMLRSVVLRAQMRTDEAEAAAKRSLEVRQALLDTAPIEPEAAEAEESQDSKTRGRRWRVAVSLSHNVYGNALFDNEKMDDAQKHYATARQIREALLEEEPNNFELQMRLAYSWSRIAEILVAQNKNSAARNAAREALQLRMEVVRQFPDHAKWRRDLMRSHLQLGEVNERKRDLERAHEHYAKAVHIAEELATQDPEHQGFLLDLAQARRHQAEVRAKTAPTEAAQSAREALQSLASLGDADENPRWAEERGYVKDVLVVLAKGEDPGEESPEQAQEAADTARRLLAELEAEPGDVPPGT